MKKKLFLLFAALLAMGQNAFAYDFSYTYQGKTLFYTIQENGVSVDNPVSNYYSSYVTGDVVIPDSVENNGTKYSVTSIGNSAFIGCSGLTSVTIPNSVTSIGSNAFCDCSGLTSVTIPNSVTSIGDWAFRWCDGLTSVTIPNSVTSIGDWAFYGCSGLTSIVVEAGNTHYDSRDNCNAIIQTDLNLLIQGCNNTIIPNTVTVIGNYAFHGCSGLTLVTIPNSVTSIGQSAFDGCSGLTSVTIPNSVTSIGDWAFYGCSGLTSVYCEATTPPTLGSDVFYNTNYCPIYVPCGSVTAYQNATNWSSYASRIQSYVDFNYSFVSNNETMGTVSVGNVDCDSSIITVTATANSGYQFTGWSDGGTGNPRTFHLTSDTSVTAFFDGETYAVVGLSSDETRGTVSGSDTVYIGDTVTLTATPNYGYRFQRWNDYNQQNPRIVTATGDITYIAYFEPKVYTVTVRSDNVAQGRVSGGGVATYLETLTISAIPNSGYQFQRWNDNNTENPRTVTVTENITYTAYFESTQDITDINTADIMIYDSEGRIIVRGAEGMEVSIFDIMGREVIRSTHFNETPVLPNGVYLVKVGDYLARKIVVVR